MSWIRARATIVVLAMTFAALVSIAAQGDRRLPKAEAQELVSSASSAADHQKLARHYAALAAEYESDAEHHSEMAKGYRRQPTASETKRPYSVDTAAHCERLAKLAADSASQAREMAKEHERMAKGAK